VCGKQGGEEKCIWGFVGEPEGLRLLGKKNLQYISWKGME
jgi:hypothetical protein